MAYSPEYRGAAEKYLDRLPQNLRQRILDAVKRLPAGDVVKMQGREGYRLAVGGFRVLFDYTDTTTEDGATIIDVVTIGFRGDIYKK